MLQRLTPLALSILFLCSTLPAHGDVRMPAIFGSQMVLQRGMPVPVWGWAEPGEEVSVTFQEQSKTAKADSDGKWSVKLDALNVGLPATLVVKGKNQLTYEDVLVG